LPRHGDTEELKPMSDQNAILARSARLTTPKFVGEVNRILRPDERVLLADDVDVEVFEGPGTRRHSGHVAVLTDRRLLIIRGRGMLGPKRPFEMELDGLERVGVTRQFNVNVTFKSRHGAPGSWKLHVGGDEALADEWMHAVHGAAQPSASGGGADEDSRRLGRLHTLLEALAPMATPERIGSPVGEGHGLEDAMQCVFRHLEGPSDARACGEILMVDLYAGPADAEDLRAVMGAERGAHLRFQLTPAQSTASDQLASAAITLLGELNAPDRMRNLWSRNDEVAVEMLCWHAIARLRLATTGGMVPVPTPPEPSA
jgi:hypothetical protein